MTKFVSAGVLLGLAVPGVALAQSTNDMNDDPDTTAAPADTTAPSDTTVVTPSEPYVAPPSDTDVDIDVHPPQVDTQPTYVQPTATYVDDDDDYGYKPISGVGIALAAGGGAGGFTSETLRNTTNVGGDWDVRATIGTRSLLAFEASYIGSAQGIDALGLDTDAVLVGNGAQGALRLNGTFNLPIQPFVYAGVGWRRYDLTNVDTNTSDVAGSDDVLEVPMGLGIAGRWRGLVVDARGEFRATSGEDLLPRFSADQPDDAHADMHRWGVKATIGAEF